MKSIQSKVADFIEMHDLSADISARILDLSSEVGELCKEYNKITGYGMIPFSPDQDFELEIGDILFSLAAIANISGINMEDALCKVIEKMEVRLERNGDVGSGS